MGNDDILPIIRETTQNANMADVIHCHSTKVISGGTWKSLTFYLSTMWDYKRRVCPKTHGLQARFSDVQHYICFPNERCGTQASHHNKLLGIRGAANHPHNSVITVGPCVSPPGELGKGKLHNFLFIYHGSLR